MNKIFSISVILIFVAGMVFLPNSQKSFSEEDKRSKIKEKAKSVAEKSKVALKNTATEIKEMIKPTKTKDQLKAEQSKICKDNPRSMKCLFGNILVKFR